MTEHEKKDNPGLLPRVAVLETKVDTIETTLGLLTDPNKGLFVRLDRIETSLKAFAIWPKIVGVAVSILTLYMLLKAAGIVP